MNFAALNPYGEAPDQAFEAFSAQLFDHWVHAAYKGQVKRFAVVNGAGGDGGVEAYAELTTEEVIALQAKWFLGPLEGTQLKQIRDSVATAQRVRPKLQRYVVCIPRDLQSYKIGRGDKLVRNPEDQRVEDLLTELETAYPDLKIEFWTEHQLEELLLLPENDGVHRFWFQKEEFSSTTLSQQFALAKAGWLRERYSPELHTYGLIQHKINVLLLSPASRNATHEQVIELLELLDEATRLLTDFGQFAGAPTAVNTLAEEAKAYLIDNQQQLHLVAQALLTADDRLTVPAISQVELGVLLKELANGGFSNLVLAVVPRLEEVLSALMEVDLPAYATRVLTGQHPHHLLIFGRPSTGKTHGVTRAVDQRLTDGCPALLVSARRAPAQNWHVLLTYALGGFTDWTDAQLFSALEALAVRADVRRARATLAGQALQDEPTRVLIALDGLDEAPDPLPWQERVSELRVLLTRHPRLRFVVTSRAYPADSNPSGLDCDETINRRLDLPQEGDVPLVELAEHYLQHYQIDYTSLPWLPEAFHDALAIRLFAQQYKNKDLATLAEPITTGLGGLLNYKIGQLEAEFTASPQLAFPPSLHLAQHGLLSVCRQLQVHPTLEHDALCEHLVAELRGRISLNQATLMLEGYANHGLILQQQEQQRVGSLTLPTRQVSLAYQQPLVDYLQASEATDYIRQSGDKRVPVFLRGRRDSNALYLTATALLSDQQIMVGEDGYWVDDLSKGQLADIQYTALANAPAAVVVAYLPKAIAHFRQGVRERNTVLKEFVLPNAHRPDVEIVRPLVHEVLCSFPSVFARDLFWSGPAAQENSRERNVGQLLSQQQLRAYDAATGLPLLFAWSLASVNNTYREHARRELSHWGSVNPTAFVQLLELVFDVADPQMQEDLAAVMLGVTSLLTQPNQGGQQLAAWILRTIFAPDRIPQLLNSVVRAYARAAIERAVALRDCTEEEAGPARPLYLTRPALLPLKLSDEEELSAESAGYFNSDERFPIVHDLAWYVLKKSYEGFLDLPTAGRSRKKAQGYNLLADYEQHYQQEIGAYEFAMSAALAYVASLGYDRTTGPGSTDATHGALSKTSTLEEKYTWLAVHHIQGYLADRLPFGHFSTPRQVRTYRNFLHIMNPATDVAGTMLEPVTWYVPVELAPEVPDGADEKLVARMRDWALRLDEPDFATWLRLPGFVPAAATTEPTQREWLPLSAHIRLPEREGRGTTALHVCCVWIGLADWQAIQHSYAGNLRAFVKDNFNSFDDLNSWQARPVGDTYASVKDVVLAHGIEEEEATTILYGPDGQEWTAYHTITRVLEHSVEGGEKEYLVPTQLVRQHLSIVDTNRQAFHTSQGTTVAGYQEINENSDPSQEFLVVDRQRFLEAGAQHQLQPFWLVSQFQKTSVDFSQQHANGHAQNIRQWLIWEEDQLHAQLYYRNWFSSQREGIL